MGQRLAKKVLLLGWDAADWKIIKPLLDRGRMPTLNRLIEQGMMGNLATLHPMLSPMLWTSIATGKRPDNHGICGFVEPDAATRGMRPASSTTRKCKALWNILSQCGLKTHMVGWYVSHPAEPINGVCVSEMYGKARVEYGEPWPLPRETVHPSSLAETLAELRVHPGELSLETLFPFVPQAARIDQTRDRRLTQLGQILAECASIQAAATWILENQEWDFLGVYFNAIDHVCHAFMNFHPPRMAHIPEEAFELYSNVVYAMYCFHDLMLARLLQLAGPETTVLIVSDHGYHCDHLRPLATPREHAGQEVWHRHLGICVVNGPHIRQDELLFGASLLDVTPTVLTLFGLPCGTDMEGKPWVQAFTEPAGVETIPSWEDVAGECGMHRPERRDDPYESHALLQQLVDLGYVAPPSDDAQADAARAIFEAKYNRARSLLHAGRPGECLPLLEELHAHDPNRILIALNLATCYHRLGRLGDCRRIAEDLVAAKRTQEVIEDPHVRVTAHADLLLGMVEFAEGHVEEAIVRLRRAEETHPRLRELHSQLGNAYLCMARWKEAEQAYLKAVEIDPDSPGAHHGLAIALLQQNRNQEAAEHALCAVGIAHQFPPAHYHLGLALARLGHLDRAVQALETCLAMAPATADAHRLLAELLPRVAGDPTRAEAHRRQAEWLSARRGARQPATPRAAEQAGAAP